MPDFNRMRLKKDVGNVFVLKFDAAAGGLNATSVLPPPGSRR